MSENGNHPTRNGSRPAPQVRRLSVTEAVRRRPFLAFGTPLLVIGLTVLFVLWVPPLFETGATLRIDEEKSGVAVLQALQTLSKGSEVNTEMAVLRSRTLVEEVTKSLALQVRLVEPARISRSLVVAALTVDSLAPEATYVFQRVGEGRYSVAANIVTEGDVTRPFSRATTETRALPDATLGAPVELIGGSVTLRPDAADLERIVLEVVTLPDAVKETSDALVVSRPDREASVVEVRFRGGDQELVQEFPNRLVRTFITGRQGSRSAEAVGTVRFLSDQLDTLQRQLASSEERLKSFQEREHIVAPVEEATSRVQQLAELKANRDIMEVQRFSLDSLMREVRAQPAGAARIGPGGLVESPYRRLLNFPALLVSPTVGEQLSNLSTLETQLGDYLVDHTESDAQAIATMQRIGTIEAQLRETVETYLQTLNSQVGVADRQLASFQGELAGIPAAQMAYVRLSREAGLLAELYTLLQTRYKEAEIQANVVDESVRMVDSAPFPREPIRPRPALSLFMALLAGSVLGLAGALAAEHRDRSVRDRMDVGRVTGSAVLGLIPQLRTARLFGGNRLPAPWAGKASHPRLVQRVDAGDAAAEAYRALRTNLLFSRIDTPPRVLTFTSPMPGDGKSTTAVNLALVMAQQGHRVLLVDADMRRGLLNEVLGVSREPGLSEVLFGRVALQAAVKSLSPREGASLDFLPSGIWPPNPAELIASSRMANLIDEARATYEMIVLDAPPLNLVTDAALLGTHCDGVVLVARAGITEEASLEYAVEQLEKVRAPLLGTVLNGVEASRQDYYGSRGKGANAYFKRS